jgi:hypothetical protein
MSGTVDRLRFRDLPEGSVALEGLLLCKYITPEGVIRYAEMATPSLHPVEALGMVTTAEDTLRAKLMEGSNHHE